MTSVPWTDDRVTTLARLWREGRSAREIAAALPGVTRNAVLGKLHRLGLLGGRAPAAGPTRPSRPRPSKAPPRPAPPRRSPPRRPGPPPSAAADPAWPPLASSVLALTPRSCRWPIGDPRAPGFGFCGRFAAAGPYCPAHRTVAFRPRRPEDAAGA